MNTKRIILGAMVSFSAFLNGCSSTQNRDYIDAPLEATAESYAKNRASMAIVLLDVKWGKRDVCRGYDNIQLMSFSFDHMPLTSRPNDAAADIVISARSLNARPSYVSLALLVPPGEYALSSFKVQVPESTSHWIAERSDLIRENKPYAGSFKVAAGEAVFIGNFGANCLERREQSYLPSLWRYYSDPERSFQRQIADYKKNYPFLDLSRAKY